MAVSSYSASEKLSRAAMLLLFGLLMSHIQTSGAIGVCYGRNGNNLPPQAEVVTLYKDNNIGQMRIYDPDQATLQALRGSNIELILDVPKDKLQDLTDSAKAGDWVQTNVLAYSADVKFRYIAVGNEIRPGDAEAQYVLPAMRNVYNAIAAANLQGQIKVSTAIDTTLLGSSSPPSEGAFSSEASSYITPIIQFLAQNGAPLLANVYPYFAYTGNTAQISLAYALFTAPGVVVQDGSYQYRNLFDAITDALYAALEKAGAPNLEIVISESGWPSEGDPAATVENAGTYYRNLINHVKGNTGTPRKPGKAIETYLFAMFDENLKAAGIEQHFGVFSPNKQQKYQLTFG
ncbi:glucan endo-1,3-beta-glucosidase-like [Mangifera indica]|uniref:glucan endo-1,3-beta-glucosidase-like n=1 Tax=Mangifera indica TaxID=29780 RepID=UPI001CF94ABE|nr:glucan endo-1,3-beta-glucosidase-like [Mangifera indica]